MATTDAIDTRVSQTTLENALRDAILFALGSRLPLQANVAALRAFATQGATGPMYSDDDLVAVGTGPYASYRWNNESTSVDDGNNVIQPTDVTANGRWLKWTSPIYFANPVGANSTTLDQITSGPLEEVIVIDRDMEEEEVAALLMGAVPAVFIETVDDKPVDLTLNSGHRWDTAFEFTVYVVTENLRDRREAAQGSAVPNDSTYGANTFDGLIKSLLCGTQLCAMVPGIRTVRVGRGYNWKSELAQRRVIRSRSFTVVATEEFVPAPNETLPQTDVMAQAHTTTPAAPPFGVVGATNPPVDTNNILTAGCAVPVASGLTQAVSSGSAVIAGNVVNYAGENHTFGPWTDTYRDLNPNGTMTFVSVSAGATPPAVTANALRIGVSSTQALAVVSDTILCAVVQTYGPRYDFPI